MYSLLNRKIAHNQLGAEIDLSIYATTKKPVLSTLSIYMMMPEENVSVTCQI